jgi:hypothetical protein
LPLSKKHDHEAFDLAGESDASALFCVFTPLPEDQCPLEASDTLTVDTGQMAEGANHLRVVAEDLAGNVAGGEVWTVYVDRTAPGIASDLEALFEENGVTQLSWAAPEDPPLADGSPGSGVASYQFRGRSLGGEWSAWATTPGPFAEIGGTTAGDLLEVEVVAIDAVGNVGPAAFGTVETGPTEVTGENIEEMELEGPDEAGGEITMYPEPAHPEPTVVGPTPQGIVTPDFSGERPCAGEGENPCGGYNGVLAASYALHWDFPGGSDEELEEEHNQEFLFFGGKGGDCTNFASQAIWWGGMQFMRTNEHDTPNQDAGADHHNEYLKGQGSWWSGYWELNGLLPKHYEFTQSWVNAHDLYEHLVEYKLARQVPLKSRLRVGDLIFYNLGQGSGTEHIDHTQIVVRVKKHYVQVAQHSNSYHKSLRKVFEKVDNEFNRKPGNKWNFFIMEPTHAVANLSPE